ncbi:Hypothetical protein, putative [Bodo saltans]|uniref:NAD(P)(+)--arginine ADP-ribosyltransferase n=1 Tax=Bodo saltans TaxID=75058 RepID=A0A0S4IML7_BODSA|nr:Hypothetical protein, putative [Bodo saltans]|eukprot:CUE73834.1 Hypothetical protein, putative [Bodo saltans]
MGNTESSCAYLSSLHTAQDQFRLTLNTTEGGGGATAAVFTSKVDYIDPSLQSLLPPSTSQQRGVGNVAGGGNNSGGGSGSSTSSGSSGQLQPQQHQPHVTCLMTSASVWASRRAVLERSAHIARMTTHPNIFRCVKSNENSTKQFTVIGAPQIEWLAPPPSTAAATTGGDRLQQWSVSETIVGVAGIVDAVATLLSTQTSNSVLTSLRLHQVAVAMHRGVSASHRIDEGTVSKMGASYFDASYVHAGRWVLHDMTTLEPQPKSGDGRIPIGVTLRSVALFVLEVLGGVGRHASLRSEIFDVVRRSLQPRAGFGAPSADDAAPDASPQRRQLSTGGTLADDLVTSSGASADDSRIATPPASPSPQGASGGGGGGGSSASATLVAMRTVESIFSILMEDIQMTIERGNHNGAANLTTTNNSSLGGGADGSFGAISNDEGAAATNAADNNSSAGTNSSPPSRSSATPVHLDQAPSFASPSSVSSDEPSSSLVTCTTGVERLLQWLHYALMDAVPRAPYLQPHDIVRLLEELRDILRVDLKDPLSALLRHGQSLYLYSAHDEHHGSGASKKLDAYEEMCHAAFVIRRDYVSNQHHLSTTTNNGSFTASSSSAASSPQSTAWERRVLRWLLHPSHVAQPEAFTLLDYIFSTIGSPTALISKEVLEAVAVDWLTEVRNPSCRAAALRYGNVLFGALPPDRLAGLLTSAGYVFMQGRTCLSRFMHMNLKSKTTHTTMTPVIPPSHVVTALNCVRAFVEAAPALVEELLCSPYLPIPCRHCAQLCARVCGSSPCIGRGASVQPLPRSIDRSMNKFLLQHVLLKELALLLRACAVVDDMMVLDVYGNRTHQGVTKLLKQTLQTFAVLATPCLQRLSSQDYKSPLQDVLPSALWFVSSCGYGVYYGTTESRERVFSIISALLLHGHVKSAATSGQIEDSGGGLPVSNVLIMRWWLQAPRGGESKTARIEWQKVNRLIIAKYGHHLMHIINLLHKIADDPRATAIKDTVDAINTLHSFCIRVRGASTLVQCKAILAASRALLHTRMDHEQQRPQKHKDPCESIDFVLVTVNLLASDSSTEETIQAKMDHNLVSAVALALNELLRPPTGQPIISVAEFDERTAQLTLTMLAHREMEAPWKSSALRLLAELKKRDHHYRFSWNVGTSEDIDVTVISACTNTEVTDSESGKVRQVFDALANVDPLSKCVFEPLPLDAPCTTLDLREAISVAVGVLNIIEVDGNKIDVDLLMEGIHLTDDSNKTDVLNAAVQIYTGDELYPKLNAVLRMRHELTKDDLFSGITPYMAILLGGLRCAPQVKSDGPIYRGVSLTRSQHCQYVKDVSVVWNTITSCTVDEASAVKFAVGNYAPQNPIIGKTHPVTFVIESATCVDVRHISQNEHEKEMILLPGTRLKVTKVTQEQVWFTQVC